LPGAHRVANRNWLRTVAKGEVANALGGDGLGLDRVEDSDGLRHSDGPATVDGGGAAAVLAVLADPERRAAVHRLHHAIVDHTYGVARDAWARALPGLHATWDLLAERYPARAAPAAPRTQPDGAWIADGNRRLNPEQNSEVDRGITRIREVGRQVIVPGMRAIEAEDASRCLAGFEHCFKGEDRLKEKVADQLKPPSDLTASMALRAIPDVVRFTFCYQETAYTNGVQVDVARLTSQGFELMKLKNTWTSDQYKGINTQWRERESGVRFEVQFHTWASLDAKELSHDAYNRLRSTEAQDEEREELEGFQSRVNGKVPVPPGIGMIEDYPRKERNG
jgi:hypothetical protein